LKREKRNLVGKSSTFIVWPNIKKEYYKLPR